MKGRGGRGLMLALLAALCARWPAHAAGSPGTPLPDGGGTGGFPRFVWQFRVEGEIFLPEIELYPRSVRGPLAAVDFPLAALRSPADWPGDRSPLPDCDRKDGPCLSRVPEGPPGTPGQQVILQIFVHHVRLGWMDTKDLAPAIYRLPGSWVIVRVCEQVRSIETGDRYPTDRDEVRKLLRDVQGHEPGSEAVADYAAAGDTLNRGVEDQVSKRGLHLDEARAAEERVLCRRRRRLGAPYFDGALGHEGTDLVVARVVAGDPPGVTEEQLGRVYDALPPTARAGVKFAAFADAFVRGYLKGAAKEGLAEKAIFAARRELRDPMALPAMLAGYRLGVPIGSWRSIRANGEGIYLMGKWLAQNANVPAMLVDVAREALYPAEQEQRRLAEREHLTSLYGALNVLVRKLATDPTLFLAAAEELGVIAGTASAEWFEVDFLSASPFEKGKLMGMALGYVGVEILLLVCGPEELWAKAPGWAAGVARRSKLAERLLKLLDEIPGMRAALGRLGKAGEELRAAGKAEKGAAGAGKAEKAVVGKGAGDGVWLEEEGAGGVEKAWKSTQTGDTTANARVLRKKMEKAGETFREGEDAHHIVPSTEGRLPETQQARDPLDQYHIDINGAENGVRLPRSEHHGTGQHRYTAYEETWRRLKEANARGLARGESKPQVRERLIEQLELIAKAMKAGKYPP